MIKKLWLIFAQTAAVGLALWFLVTVLKPEWRQPAPATVVTVTKEAAAAPPMVNAQASYREAAKLAKPAVVNIFTSPI